MEETGVSSSHCEVVVASRRSVGRSKLSDLSGQCARMPDDEW